ncbi:MAG: apolipoprotein N-acyltransferase [Deltaproteobacteria bacterium]|nr:apolipoprotein N-acyltransferase [Deltaproteobacteria bacterium]
MSAETPTAAKKAKKVKPPKPPGMSGRERLRRMGLATLAGVLVFLSFPLTTEASSNIWPLAWVALVPFLESLRGLRGKQAFWIGAWCGLVTNFGGFWWISEVLREFGHLPPYVYWPLTLLNSFYQGLMFALVGLFIARTNLARQQEDPTRGPFSIPIWQIAALYTVTEFLYPMIFPWYLANGQYRFLPAIQIAELGGVMSITFVMVAFNAALHRFLARRLHGDPLPRRAMIIALLGTAAVLVYGQIRIAMVDAQIADAPKVKLGLVEADIGIFEKQAKHLEPSRQRYTRHRNLLKHQWMSAELERQGVDLVVWPESSYFPVGEPFMKRKDDMALALGADGTLSVWRFQAKNAGVMPTPADFGVAPSPHAPIVRALAVDALHEGTWAALTASEVTGEVAGQARTSKVPAGARALSLVHAMGSGPTDDQARAMAWVVGERGLIARGRLGEDLETKAFSSELTLTAVDMRAPRDGIIVGEAGTIVEIDGDRPRPIAPDPVFAGRTFRAVAWGPGGEIATLALAVGDGGLGAVRVDGAWQATELHTSANLTAVAFDRAGQPWIAGQGGFVATRVDQTWRPRPLPSAADVSALAVDPLGQALAATREGALYVWPEGATGWREVARPQSAASPSGPGSSGSIVSLASLGWIQTMPLPRDVRWVRQGVLPLPTHDAFEADSAREIHGIPEAERASIQRGFKTSLLFGGLTWAEDPGKDRPFLYNTAVLLNEQGRVEGLYDKVYLLAFGEYMPFGETFPKLYDMFPQAGRFTPGKEVKVFDWRGYKLGIMVCYEDLMADFTAKLADLHPNIIINVTNDAWFGKTSEPWLHLALAAFRSVENRLELVRSTNTGISAFIDPTGRLVSATRIEDAETLVGEVPMMPGHTLYAVIGNLFSWLLLGLLIVDLVRRRLRLRKLASPVSSPATPTSASPE